MPWLERPTTTLVEQETEPSTLTEEGVPLPARFSLRTVAASVLEALTRAANGFAANVCPASVLERWTGLGDIVVYTMAHEPVYTDDGCIVVIRGGYDHLSGMIPEDRPIIGLDEVPTEGATWQPRS